MEKITKRQELYNDIVFSCISILKEKGYTQSSDLYSQWGDDKDPAYWLLRKEIKSIKSIFRKNSELAILSLYFHLDNALDGFIPDDDNFNYYTVAADSIKSFIR